MQIDGLIDWYGKRSKKWRPKIIGPLHSHRKTIERIPWAQFAKAHLEPQHQRIEASKEIFKHLKRFSRIQARTSSWRASNEDFIESVEQLSKLKATGSFVEMGTKGLKDHSRALAMDVPIDANEGEQANAIKVDGEDVVLLDQHDFDGPFDVGGETDEARQMREAEEMAKAMRLEQVVNIKMKDFFKKLYNGFRKI